jgi:lactoylglutathione lyase
MKFNKLIPELMVSDIKKSSKFYLDIGFKIEYQRLENKFMFLSLEGSQLMIQEDDGKIDEWSVGKLRHPYGKGMHFQIEVKNADRIHDILRKKKYSIKFGPKKYWFRQDNKMLGMKSLLVQDPDGYLLMFNQDIGSKKVN